MRRLLRDLKIALIALVALVALAIATEVHGSDVQPFDYNAAINRLVDYSRTWHNHERAQQELHRQANEERAELCRNGYLDFCVIDEERQAVVFVTHYHAVEAQTDASPCIGAGLTNVCELSKTENILALSQDLVGRADWKKFTYGEYVVMEHDYEQCNGVFRVEDTMRADLRKRADILQPKGVLPGNCAGAVVKAIENIN